MGIVYNLKVGKGYKNLQSEKVVSYNNTLKRLTPQNVNFLKSIGFRIKSRHGTDVTNTKSSHL